MQTSFSAAFYIRNVLEEYRIGSLEKRIINRYENSTSRVEQYIGIFIVISLAAKGISLSEQFQRAYSKYLLNGTMRSEFF